MAGWPGNSSNAAAVAAAVAAEEGLRAYGNAATSLTASQRLDEGPVRSGRILGLS
jgi:hypothetical protein